MISYVICLSPSDLLHLVWESLGLSMLLQMAIFHSFLLMSNIPLCVCVWDIFLIHSSVRLLMDTDCFHVLAIINSFLYLNLINGSKLPPAEHIHSLKSGPAYFSCFNSLPILYLMLQNTELFRTSLNSLWWASLSLEPLHLQLPPPGTHSATS